MANTSTRKSSKLSVPDRMTDTFKDFVEDQLGCLHGLTFRKMFGGYGLYEHRRFFGILHKGRLYFKTHGPSRTKFVAHGMAPFRPHKTQMLKNYYEVPPDVLENAEELTQWAREASRPVPSSRKHK